MCVAVWGVCNITWTMQVVVIYLEIKLGGYMVRIGRKKEKKENTF